ncbi:MAG: hypothetical protein LH631_08480 [Alkalinema sp. CAN_BIN05]|nr:hypothetical protein [Alkalinema sp. CAN_BIN05]
MNGLKASPSDYSTLLPDGQCLGHQIYMMTVRGSDRPVMNGETWVPVQSKGVNGWATARYLAL